MGKGASEKLNVKFLQSMCDDLYDGNIRKFDEAIPGSERNIYKWLDGTGAPFTPGLIGTIQACKGLATFDDLVLGGIGVKYQRETLVRLLLSHLDRADAHTCHLMGLLTAEQRAAVVDQIAVVVRMIRGVGADEFDKKFPSALPSTTEEPRDAPASSGPGLHARESETSVDFQDFESTREDRSRRTYRGTKDRDD